MKRPGNMKDEDRREGSVINHILKEGFNIPIEAPSAPTTAGGELPDHGDSAHDTSFLYINLSGTTYKIAITAV